MRSALSRLGISCEDTMSTYGSLWRREATCEALENDLVDRDYARSPRNTRGATRA